ncbi:hypothetical protein C8A00DRAFT_34249 [Chaetomidium leptoderma]|uniref:Uncharacterized protein n=1 Tax=Chaetomidium leptoderma TaxID=669021 RepID=A0AAN6ZXZ8_9PEZI|nr:hypothetical protein C8A00DRAFT_34249 [Chaetomidium leptoderma]
MADLTQVPDLIRDLVERNEAQVTNGYGLFGAVPPELHQAYLSGDYATIQKYTDMTSNDLNPIYQNIAEKAEKAFFRVTNPSNQTVYWLSIAGPTDKPYGYMWTYCAPVPHGLVGDPVTQPVVQFGSYSANANTLGISNVVWDNSTAQLAAAGIATTVMTVVTKYMKKRIAGLLVPEAVDGAVAEAGAEVVAEGIISSAAWASIASTIGGFIVGAVAGAIVYFLVMYIVNFVHKAYKIAVNIYNWDPKNAYVIESWYSDNAILDGDQAFNPVVLPHASNTITMPDGMVVPTLDTVYQYAAIVFDNKNQILEGLGVAVQVRFRSSNSGFQLKYLCPRFGDNKIGIHGGLNQSLSDFYANSSTWAGAGSYSAQSSIPDLGIPISCTTISLSGRSDQFYEFDVHIGLKPNNDFLEPLPEQPERQPLRKPERCRVPGPGEVVKMPSGTHHKVV